MDKLEEASETDKLEEAREKVMKRQLHGPRFSDDVD